MSSQDRLIEILQKYPENELSKKGIIPLLKKMGYEKIEFFGGQSEQGKDIIFWEKDKWGEIVLRVAQVKHFKFTNKASDSNSLQTVINQLTSCFTKSLPYIDKIYRKPTEVFLITTHNVDVKSLLTRFDKELSLKDQNIKIIDGGELASKLLMYMPEFVKEITGLDFEFDSKLPGKFSNEILLKALGKTTLKDIRAIYSDIDFSLGKITTDIFFNSTFTPKREKVEVSVVDWLSFKTLCASIKKEFELNFLDLDIDLIEEKHKHIIVKNDEISNANEKLEAEINFNNKEIDALIQSRNAQAKLVSEIKQEKEEIRIKQPKTNLKSKSKKRTSPEYDAISKKLNNAQNKYSKIKDDIDQIKKETQVHEKNKFNNEAWQSNSKILIPIDGFKLADQIIEKRKWIEKSVAQYNESNPSSEVLKGFIQSCDSILQLTSKIFDSSSALYFNCVGYSRDRQYRMEYETTRFRLPIENIFDTGLNISVLGDAGAGKSTSLEMYAISRKKSDKKIIFVPLGYIVQDKQSIKEQPLDDQNALAIEIMLTNYFSIMGLDISLQELQLMFKTEKVVLLLDGLDEAIKNAPFLPSDIYKMSLRYKNVQFILTSRMHGEYTSTIPFFSVTLLPFTLEQRNGFISKWFEDEKDSTGRVRKILLHLKENESIDNIVRNPLLTTVLCVLAQYSISLPKTEIRLYEERLRLFTGYYDNVKHICSRIQSVPTSLEKVAQKLAYYLHKENKREEDISVLKSQAKINLKDKHAMTEIDLAFKELIYPCEILVPMSPDGKYGFGHLRFQEHLAARELMNRNIEIVPLLSQNWWRGALSLFAQMSDNIDWLITEIYKHDKLHLPIIKELINSRHKLEKERLIQLVKFYVELKSGDGTTEYFSFDEPEEFL